MRGSSAEMVVCAHDADDDDDVELIGTLGDSGWIR